MMWNKIKKAHALAWWWVIFIMMAFSFETIKGRELDKLADAIEVTGPSRSYVSGPINGNFMLTLHDTVKLYAGELPPSPIDPSGTSFMRIRKWTIWNGEESRDGLCLLHRIHDYGLTSVFLCPKAGTYIAYAMDYDERDDLDTRHPPNFDGTADAFSKFWLDPLDLLVFDLLPEEKQFNASWLRKTSKVIQSDPFEITPSDFCYYWHYRLTEKARVGYVYRESDHLVGTSQGSTYILLDLEMWIVEPNALGDNERNSPKQTLQPVKISSYSKIVTHKFDAKGLFPCLRHVHPSVEIGEIKFWEETEELDSPHWKVEIKIHTNTLISTITDVGWTISSRQHIALFHCFVGDVRVFVNVQDFGFVSEGLSDRTSVNWERSSVEKSILDYMKLKIKHVYGHPTAYVGMSETRSYEPGQLRTDVVVVNNPCVAQEFAIASSARLYIVEEFLTNFLKNVYGVVLPGFDTSDAEGKYKLQPGNNAPVEDIEERIRRHKTFLKIADFAITPTHVALLMEDSTIYLHSRSAYYKGLAFMKSTGKDRLGALVKRRWCSKTDSPKTNNMIIPAYSPRGTIVIIQIFPMEGALPTSILNPSSSCLVPDSKFFGKSINDIHHSINESCIHRGQAVNRSDERGLLEAPDLSNCDNSNTDNLPINSSYLYNADPGSFRTFLMNQDTIYSHQDPHFPSDIKNIAIYKTNDDKDAMKFHNKAFTFHVDRSENNPILPEILARNGLRLIDTEINLHRVDFTPVRGLYLVGVQFQAKEFEDFELIPIMITTMFTKNMPFHIFPEPKNNEIEKILDIGISFPGVILIRKNLYMIRNIIDSDPTSMLPYTTKFFPINTAITAYIIDLGNVYVFSSLESKYARPLTFFNREYIHEILENILVNPGNDILLEKRKRQPVFNFNTTGSDLFDIVVTEQGMVSVLKRRSMTKRLTDDTQTVFIGSVVTQEALREVRPFATSDQIFQLGTPDGEIVYGKFMTRYLYPACEQSWIDEITQTGNYNVVQTTCLMPHTTSGLLPYCVSSSQKLDCTPWIYLDDKHDPKEGTPDHFVIGKCNTDSSNKSPKSCIVPVRNLDGVELLPPDNSPNSEIVSAEILNIPYHSILSGSLLMEEEKITMTQQSAINNNAPVDTTKKLCPFSSFIVDHEKFQYAEIGYKTRITAEISYRGTSSSEAELIIEYDNIPGVDVEINSSEVQEHDQTTLTKTIDITFRLSDMDIYNMQKTKMITYFGENVNLAKEPVSVFSLTVRPSIVNLRCSKDGFFITTHILTGCNPLGRMRFMAETSPVKRHVVTTDTDKSDHGFKRVDDYLEVKRDEVWHQQRQRFNCEKRETKKCKIPYAHLYGDNVFDLSWRDPFVPQFEQFLHAHSRLVTGNIVLYDIFGFDIVMNITNLDAGCFYADKWYNTLLDSVKQIESQDTTDQEDLYQYFFDCFDHSIKQRDKPKVLASSEYRLLNATNYNRIRFDVADASTSFRRTKNRNQFLLLRAAVINTGFNRFTYCKLLDTFFLVRIVGLQAPRKGLSSLAYGGIVLGLVVFLGIVYCVFAYCYTWKLDVANLDTNPDDELLDDDNDFEYQEDRKFASEVREQHQWRTAISKLQALSRLGQFKGMHKN